jgi:hypothetical protein
VRIDAWLAPLPGSPARSGNMFQVAHFSRAFRVVSQCTRAGTFIAGSMAKTKIGCAKK